MKIRGNTVGTPMKRPDFNQTDPKKSDYILNNPIPAITENDEDKIVKVKDGKYKLVDDNGAKYSSGLDYATSLDGQGYMVTGLGTCTDKNIVIPDTHNGLPVTALRYQAFYNCTSLISIEMPDSITSIGENMAFRGCTSLKSVRISDSVTSIETATFKGCSALEKVVMGNLITKIGDGAFNGCTSLLNIDIPNSVTKIGGATFENCTSLTSVVIPKSVTSIGSQAFKGCTSLTIYCEAESQPSGWASNWNYSNCPVVWGFANDFISVNEKFDDITFDVGISDDGYWVINGVKTEHKSIGADGTTPTITISADGYWVINGTKTEYKAQGEKGDTYTLTEADKKVIVDQVSNRVATVDKVKAVSMSGGLENIGVVDDEYDHGIYWHSDFRMNEDEHFDGNMLVNCKASHHLPIAAGEHVEFEVDEKDKVVRIKGINKGAIIDVAELPTLVAETNLLYRVPTGTFFIDGEKTSWACIVVENLPRVGEPVTTDMVNITLYYERNSNSVSGYADEMISGAYGLPVGWYPVEDVMQLISHTWCGVVFDENEISDIGTNKDVALLIEYELYQATYNNGILDWDNVGGSVGWVGTGYGAEIFNSKANIASGDYSHAEGRRSYAKGESSHAEGDDTTAIGRGSHSEGNMTIARGNYSHTEGEETVANGRCQHVQGRNNVEDTENKYAHIVGNGESASNRSNAHTLDWQGNAWFAGKVKVGGTGQDDENAKTLATTDNTVSKFTVAVDSSTPVWDVLTAMQDAGATVTNFNILVLQGYSNSVLGVKYSPWGNGSMGMLAAVDLYTMKTASHGGDWSTISFGEFTRMFKLPLPYYDESNIGQFLTIQSNGEDIEPQWTSIPSAEGVNFNE